jgi:hypothetical protein
VIVSEGSYPSEGAPPGSSLPGDLTGAQLVAAPVLASVDALLIDDLSVEEADAFFAAIDR